MSFQKIKNTRKCNRKRIIEWVVGLLAQSLSNEIIAKYLKISGAERYTGMSKGSYFFGNYQYYRYG
jgi:hypothetical protein